MGETQAYKAMQRARVGSSSAGSEEIDDGVVDGSFHSPEWPATRLASLETSCTVTLEESKRKQKHNYIHPVSIRECGAGINAYQQWKILPAFTSFLGEYDGLYKMFRESCFGSLLEFHIGGYFASHLIHALLAREIIPPGATTLSDSEIWFGLGQHSCRFGQREFCLITGLRFSGGDDIDPETLQHVPDGILDRYFGGGDVTVERLAHRFRDRGFRSTLDAYKVALVTFASCIVLGHRPKARVDSWLFHLVENVHHFNQFPWGRYAFEMTRYYAQQGPRAPSCGNDIARYHLYGFIWALQVWAMEAIPSIAHLYKDARSSTMRQPRFAHWTFPRRNFIPSEIFTDNMEALETLEPTQEEIGERYFQGVDTPLTSGTFHFKPPETLVPKQKLTQSKKRKAASSSNFDLIERKILAQMTSTAGTQRNETVLGTSCTMVPDTLQSGQVNKEGEKKTEEGDKNKKKDEEKKKSKRITVEDLDRAIETLYQRLTAYIDQRLSGEDAPRKGELEADTDRMMREYRAQLDAERALKLLRGQNHSSGKTSHKKDRKDKDAKKHRSKRRKHSRRRWSSDSSSSSSYSETSSDDEERESRRPKSKSKRDKKKHRSRNKHLSTDDEESEGPLPLSTFFGNVKS